ncbi:MAG TPA: glycosyltransferase, partial [Caulobacter sp.]|nr:glycosyltransferase [Caulobacter sp.]
FAGFLTGEALAAALASGDIFLNPSTTETFGNVNLEAMACGLAMVCADAPNTRALMRHERNAVLCAPDHPGSYAEALSRLLVDDGARRRLGAEALERSAAYRWSEILDEVAKVYVEARDRHTALSALVDPSVADAALLHPERSGRVEPQPAGLLAL